VRDLSLKLASLGNPETRAEYREELTAYLRAHQEALSPEVVSRIDLNPMRAFDATDSRTRATMRDAPKLLDRLAPEDAEHFAQVRLLLDADGIRYELDPTLVRGLDYYTRTLFEFSSDALGAQSGVAGGGRYDRLIEQLDGPRTPACGWAAGVERILIASAEQREPVPEVVDLFVALAQREGVRNAFELTHQARRAGLQAQLELAGRSLKGQLKHADRLRARYVAILGEDGQASLKDMQSGEQRDTELQNVIPTILRGNL
jgi:histidyl-tRNA synthetase